MISYQEWQRDWPYEARQPIFMVPIPEDERGDEVNSKASHLGGLFLLQGEQISD